MPVIRIRALTQPNVDTGAVLTTVTRESAGVLNEPVEATSATSETISPGEYVEGTWAATVQPPETHPPLVSVAFEGRSADLVERTLVCIADRVYDGGRIVRRD
jgi:hypothetical protein